MCFSAAVAILFGAPSLPADVPAVGLGKAPDLARAQWIWSSEDGLQDAGPLSYFRRKFVLPAPPVEATLALTADNGFKLYVNNNRVAAELERYRTGEPSRVRSWTCFFLARTLGKLRDHDSVDLLCAALDEDPTEAEFGIPDPPNVFLHNAITPLYRAPAADALGRIGRREAVPSLLRAAANFDNAMDVRHASADSLRRLADPSSLPQLEKLAADYPEAATGQTLREACVAARTRP